MFTRTEVQLMQPSGTSARSRRACAAAAPASTSRASARRRARRLELNVRKAYYGLKLARDVIDMLDEGAGYIDDGAEEDRVGPGEGTGNTTVTDGCACA